MSELHDQVRKKIEKAGRILVVSHRKPDADTLGGALALRDCLVQWGKKVTLACIDQPEEGLEFLPGVEDFVQEFELKDFDLMVIIDAGASYMTNFHLKYEGFFDSGLPIINIDHHASNDLFGDLNIVEAEEASVTVMLYEMFRYWGVEIDKNMATCLLAGIYNDTGSFMHSNTDAKVMKIAADLLSLGAKIGDITRNMFNTTKISTLKLWGKVLENTRVTQDNVVISIVCEADFDETSATPEELSGLVDYLNMVPKSRLAILVNKDEEGNVKGSFRTRRDDVDVSRIAAVFGGGGHSKASGFSMQGKFF